MESIFSYDLWRKPNQSESSFWLKRAEEAGYKIKPCDYIEGDESKLSGWIMDWAIADAKDPRTQTTEVSRMVDRVFQRITGKNATQPEQTTSDQIVRKQRTTCPQLFALLTSDLAIKEVIDDPTDAKAVTVHVVNQGKFSTRVGSVLRLEINNGPGCTGKIAKRSEFPLPVIKAGETIRVKVTSAERLKQAGLERLAYSLAVDAKNGVVELDETNNVKCIPAYLVR